MLKVSKQNDVLKKDSLTLLIYGFPGIGKTSLTQTAEKTALLDFDEGIHRAVNRQDVYQIQQWEDVEQFIADDYIGKEGYKTVIIDTVGTALDDYLADFVIRQNPKNQKKGGGLSLSGYGDMKDVFKLFYDRLRKKNINLIMIAHLTEKQEGDEFVLRPKITGGTYDILVSKCDQMGYMYSVNKKINIDFMMNDRSVTKDAGGIGKVLVPNYASEEYQDFFQREVIDKSINAIEERNKKAIEYADWIKDKRSIIAKFDSVDQVNQMMVILKEEQDIAQGVVLQAKVALNAKAKELEFTFNKDKSIYEQSN